MIGQLVKDLLQAVVVVPLVVRGIVVIIPSGHHRNPDWSKQLCFWSPSCCIFGINQFSESYWPDWIFLLSITCALPRQAHQQHSGTLHEPHCTFTHSNSLQSHVSSKSSQSESLLAPFVIHAGAVTVGIVTKPQPKIWVPFPHLDNKILFNIL